MQLSTIQNAALDSIGRWQRGFEMEPFLLAGYAGTGKTTVLQEYINKQPQEILCLAPTGKAASVLAKRLTNSRVSTVHRALYVPVTPDMSKLQALEDALVERPEDIQLLEALEAEKVLLASQDVRFSRKQDSLIAPGQLVVVDEASMVTKKMQRDLLETGAKILYVGDPGQLPPVNDEGFFKTHPPNIMLTEVHRQALNSPIIRLSMRVRNGESIERFGEGSNCSKLPKEEFSHEQWLQYDQVLTGKNESRRKINRYFRTKAGRKGWWPEAGEKVICLKNEQDNENCFINGVLGEALSDFVFNSDAQEVIGDVLYDASLLHGQPFYRYPFQIHYDGTAVEEPWYDRQGLREFDYAYAITVHKSQGSEWNRVLLADDGMKSADREFRKHWLYTAVTRAKEELVWLY